MEREKRNNTKQNEAEITKRKWYSVIGFLISITLLSIAIFMSINQENNERLSRLNTTDLASADLTRNLNEIKDEKNTLMRQSLENVLSNSITSSLGETNTTTENNETNTTVSTNSNMTNEVNNSTENKETNVTENEQTNEENVEEQTNNNEIKDNSNDNEKNSKDEFIKPVEGEIINIFSMDRLVYSNTLQEWTTHRGLDIKSEKGVDVKASKAGTVKAIKTDPRYGMSVTIEHKDGFTTVYSCLLSTNNISEGDNVEQGQVIGSVGNSGVFEVSDGMHLHFEMLKDGEYVNPDMYIK